nr:probable chitinase 10 [Maniola hyperantus]
MPILVFLLLFGYGWASLLPNGCPADFSINRLLPHETECGKFYACSNGRRVLMQCPRGLSFDEDLQECKTSEKVKCKKDELSTNVGELNTNVEDKEEERRIRNKRSDTYLPNGCPMQFSVNKLLPHHDCKKFYKCSFGIKVEMDCPPGLHFDAGSEKCDRPEIAGCETKWLPNGCPKDFEVHHLLAHEWDCSRFYYCVFGEKVERNCPAGLYFDPKIQIPTPLEDVLTPSFIEAGYEFEFLRLLFKNVQNAFGFI